MRDYWVDEYAQCDKVKIRKEAYERFRKWNTWEVDVVKENE